METEGGRLRFYLESKGVKDFKKFCTEYKFPYNSFITILSGSRNLGINVLKKVLKIYPNLNTNWVITGFGNPELGTDTAIKSGNPPSVELALEMLENPAIQNRIKDIASQ